MWQAATSHSARKGIALVGLLSCLLAVALWIGRAQLHVPLLIAAGATLFLATLVKAEAGLTILIASMLLSPEIGLGAAGGTSLEGRREVILRTDDLILLLVGLAWVARMAIHKDLGAIRRTRLNASIGAFVTACLVSTLIGIELGRVRPLVGLCFIAKYIEYFIIFFMTVNYVRSADRLRRLLVAVLLTGAVILIYAYWQIPLGIRPSAPFEGPKGEPNTLGGYLVMMFSVSAAIALTVADRRWRRACGAMAIAALPPLLATLSRSSWVALGASVVALLILSPERRRLAGIGVVAAAFLFFVHPEGVAERIAYTFQGHSHSVSIAGLHLDPSSSARVASWGQALGAFAKHPFLGLGVTGFGFLDAQYFRLLVEVGIFGLAAFACLVGATGRALLGASRGLQDPLHRGLGMGMTAALAGLLAHAIWTNTFMLIRIMEPFWLLTGLVVAATALEAAPHLEEEARA
ncbi:MAG: O-antigen ligase family protein [Acidobacteriota bacterium]